MNNQEIVAKIKAKHLTEPTVTISGNTIWVERNGVSVTGSIRQFELWLEGSLIQNVFPELTEDEREFLISGMTPDEWSAYIGEEE